MQWDLMTDKKMMGTVMLMAFIYVLGWNVGRWLGCIKVCVGYSYLQSESRCNLSSTRNKQYILKVYSSTVNSFLTTFLRSTVLVWRFATHKSLDESPVTHVAVQAILAIDVEVDL
ncbi:hypothetical protein EYC80_000480 [Monilinia laxa]|uniref:Uncharacterized protein n=1 Tax=Monilinia laxa TaxID=61186 RepID=A0A5N6KAR2_MONLA|nr:hypothetical protein EYC80_000480 [Monilinia laxa]